MVGNEKKKVLQNFPEMFPQFLLPEYCETTVQLWKDFEALYKAMTSLEQPPDGVFFEKAKNWIELSLSLGEKIIGYENARITPYMHILVYHIPKFLVNETPLKSFTGQGIEKINDIVRSIYDNKSNRHDACREAILALKGTDHLQEYERMPHQYQKRNDEYWSSGIFEQRRKRPRLCVDERDDVTLIDVESMCAQEVKDKLKELNINTRVRSIDKLKQMLKDAIAAAI